MVNIFNCLSEIEVSIGINAKVDVEVFKEVTETLLVHQNKY